MLPQEKVVVKLVDNAPPTVNNRHKSSSTLLPAKSLAFDEESDLLVPANRSKSLLLRSKSLKPVERIDSLLDETPKSNGDAAANDQWFDQA